MWNIDTSGVTTSSVKAEVWGFKRVIFVYTKLLKFQHCQVGVDEDYKKKTKKTSFERIWAPRKLKSQDIIKWCLRYHEGCVKLKS